MKIVVLDAYTVNPGDNPLSELMACGDLSIYDRTSNENFLQRALPAEILITNKTPIRAESIAALEKLRFMAVLATGYDVIDVVAARNRNIPVSNVPAYGTDSVAQHAFALLLELCNHVGEHARSVADGEWSAALDWSYWKSPIVEISDLTLGIVGLGRIGLRVAELGHSFGMNVLYSGRGRREDLDFPAGYVPIEELFATADVVSLHCSLSRENQGFVNRDLLITMKKSAFLINTARGALIDQADLAWALRNGCLAGAALDVLPQEPPSSDHPLLSVPHCLITPHLAWSSLHARKRILQTTVDNVRAFQAGHPINVVN